MKTKVSLLAERVSFILMHSYKSFTIDLLLFRIDGLPLREGMASI